MGKMLEKRRKRSLTEDETAAEVERRLLAEDELDQHAKERREREELYLRTIRDEMVWNTVEKPNAKSKDKDNGGWQQQRSQKKKTKKRIIREILKTDALDEETVDSIDNIWELSHFDKWRLYRYWLFKYKNNIRDKIREHERKYSEASGRLKEAQNEEDYCIVKSTQVVGLTTTGAAKYQTLLQMLQPQIVIVEEAAEILEAHAITSLNPSCKHLVLIGDHKQLRPKPTVYELAERYNLKISLFERLINNGLPVVTLQNQHRMRPQISLMLREIYPNLHDDESVLNYPNVKGVAENMFFLDHAHPEDHHDELLSKGNNHEASLTAALCQYMLQQGYQPAQITVLTPYSGQLMKLKNQMPKNRFSGVRVTLVDNFQGEENDIILLSLVRSNMKNDLGFLREDNRVCVALSRAKVGLYVIGNFTMLKQKTKLWAALVKSVEERGFFGSQLMLYCQNHREDGNKGVQSAKDFRKIPEGGCLKPCGSRLKCGHACEKVCHPYDPEHKKYQCMKKCERIPCLKKLPGHTCRKKCFQDCGECKTKVEKLVPTCGHKQKVSCYLEPEKILCQAPCEHRLSCGHYCPNTCSEEHVKQCVTKVYRQLICGHTALIPCYQSISKVSCEAPCGKQLDCDHACSGKCGPCFTGRLHVSCKQKCGRVLVCGHQCPVNCTRQCPPCKKKCQNRCIHSQCTEECGKSCVPCQEPCAWHCVHKQCTKKCSEPCNRQPCNEPCRQQLPICGHPCIGLCGEQCPSKCRICDKDEVTTILFGEEDEEDARFVELADCGHIIEVNALDKWMNTATDDTNSKSIQLKGCPVCKTTIRQNLRYGTIINKVLNDIEKVKAKIHHQADENLENKKEDVKLKALELENFDGGSFQIVTARIERCSSVLEMHYAENLLSLLLALAKLPKKLAKIFPDMHIPAQHKEATVFLQSVYKVQAWAYKDRIRFSEQELNESAREVERLQIWAEYVAFSEKIEKIPTLRHKCQAFEIDNCLKDFAKGNILNDDHLEELRQTAKKIKEKFPLAGLGIDEQERLQILKAMALASGHWYKCPKGKHFAL